MSADTPEWFFTFGAEHHAPDGTPLRDRYVRVTAPTWLAARLHVIDVFDRKWCDQYDSAEAAGVEQYGLTEYEVPQPAEFPQEAGL